MMKNRAGTKNPAAVMLTMTTVIFVVFREEYPGNGRIKVLPGSQWLNAYP